MADFTIQIDRKNELKIDLEIQTTANTDEPQEVRLVLETPQGSFLFPAEQRVAGGKAFIVNIPPLVGMVETGIGTAKLEVIIGNRYFSPWTSGVELQEAARVSAGRPVIEIEQDASPVQVSVSSPRPAREIAPTVRVSEPVFEEPPAPPPLRRVRRNPKDLISANVEGQDAADLVDQMIRNGRT